MLVPILWAEGLFFCSALFVRCLPLKTYSGRGFLSQEKKVSDLAFLNCCFPFGTRPFAKDTQLLPLVSQP